jgi:hypothetical protein
MQCAQLLQGMQGLHEIGAVLLVHVGESYAYSMLQRLVCTHLRDSTREVLDAVTESLDLLHVLVSRVDKPLALHFKRKQLHPHYFISWMITWFAHNVDSELLPRLFDLFLASHPLMPMYLYVVAMHLVRFMLAECNGRARKWKLCQFEYAQPQANDFLGGLLDFMLVASYTPQCTQAIRMSLSMSTHFAWSQHTSCSLTGHQCSMV